MISDNISERTDVLNADELLKRCLGKIEFMEHVLGLLLERGGLDIASLKEAISNDDYGTAYQIAHRLKGAFANASANQLSRLAEEICEDSQAGNTDRVHEKLVLLEANWDDLTNMLLDSDRVREM